ncbi:MAG TPA: hypothetical protein VKB40_08875 [Candidatus Acidoferrales bacterium]|nr:hypothetical protein [Candidatus Acidoferrales bacterium]
MKYKIVCGCAIFAFALVSTLAQTKQSLTGKCSKPDTEQSVPAGDVEGHTFSLVQFKCTAKGEVNGEEGKDGIATEQRDGTAKHAKSWGVFVETFEGGDKVFYDYQTTVAAKSDGTMAGTNKYQITGGTGKMKGIKGSGTCKLTDTGDGGSDYSCTGEYTIGTAAPAKK